MEFKGKDFDGDRPAQYAVLREEMAKMFGVEMYGPVSPSTLSPIEMQGLCEEERKEERNRMKMQEQSIKQGYNRILEKVKDIRQRFSKAIVQGSRSGSGNIVMEHFDSLKQIYGGSPSATKLAYGVETEQINSVERCVELHEHDDGIDPDTQSLPSLCDAESSSSSTASFSEETSTKMKEGNLGKRKATTPLSKLVDNKRKHLEKRLSASQRDAILLKEARDDAALRHDLIDAMEICNESFTEAMKDVGETMKLLTQSMSSSFQALAATLSPAPSYHSHQGMWGNVHQQQSMMDYLNAPNVQPPSVPFSIRKKRRVTIDNVESDEEEVYTYDNI